MRPVDILEWAMGWPWPVVVALGALMAWGIWRFLTWDEQVLKEDISGEEARPPEGCACTCS